LEKGITNFKGTTLKGLTFYWSEIGKKFNLGRRLEFWEGRFWEEGVGKFFLILKGLGKNLSSSNILQKGKLAPDFFLTGGAKGSIGRPLLETFHFGNFSKLEGVGEFGGPLISVGFKKNLRIKGLNN